jgi:hypothetical protein
LVAVEDDEEDEALKRSLHPRVLNTPKFSLPVLAATAFFL